MRRTICKSTNKKPSKKHYRACYLHKSKATQSCVMCRNSKHPKNEIQDQIKQKQGKIHPPSHSLSHVDSRSHAHNTHTSHHVTYMTLTVSIIFAKLK